MLSLFPDEKIISKSDDDSVILTTHRICYEYKSAGKTYNQNILLENITSFENLRIKNFLPVVIILCGLLLVTSALVQVFAKKGEFSIPQKGDSRVLLIGGVLIVGLGLYGYKQWGEKKLIVVASSSTKMKISLNGMAQENITAFVNKIEQTKNNRLTSLNNRNQYGTTI